MEKPGRMLLAMLIGLVLQFVLIIAIDVFGSAKFPVPSGFVGSRLERQAIVVANYPTWYLGLILLCCSIFWFVCFWSFVRICGSGIAIVAFISPGQIGILGRFYQCSYPIWFQIMAFGCLMVVALLVARIEKIGRYAVKKAEHT